MIDTSAIEERAPIVLWDGCMGMVIRIWADKIGVQVPGEEDIRWIPAARVEDLGGGALVELKT